MNPTTTSGQNTSPSSPNPESLWRVLSGYSLLAIVPIALALVVLAAKFQGLATPQAWDHAQVARHIAQGDGLVTSAIRPLSFAFLPTLQRHPDLYNAPLHPLALAAAFKIAGPGDRAVAVTGLILWMASIWLTFLVSRRWFGDRVAALATVFYGANVTAVAVAVGGLPHPLLTILVLLACWAVVPKLQDTDAPAEPGKKFDDASRFRHVAAGVLCALAMLANLSLVVLLFVLAWYVIAMEQHRWRALGLMLLGFALFVAPWLWLNHRHASHLVFGLGIYDLMSGTQSHPGDSIWRMTNSPGLLGFVVRHPHELFAKVFRGLGQVVSGGPSALNPVVGIFFLAVLPHALRNSQRRALALLTVVGIVASILVSCLLRPDPYLLIAWAPLVATLAAARLTDWVQQRVGPLSLRWLKFRGGAAKPVKKDADTGSMLQSVLGLQYWGRVAAYAGIVLAVMFPLLSYIVLARPTTDLNLSARLEPLRKTVPATAVVVTDQPALVAWYGGQRAVWLPQRETGLAVIESRGGPFGAAYVTPAVSLDGSQVGDWWSWVISRRGVYHGLVPVELLPGDAALRVRPEKTAPDKNAATVERLSAEAAKNPKSAEAHTLLAVELYRQDRLREAADEFRAASQIDPQSTEALLGLWQLLSRLNDNTGNLALAERAADLDPRMPNAPAALAEAAHFFEQVAAANPRNPWVLLDAALCHVKLQRWDRAEDCSRRAAAAAPTALPLRLVLGDLCLQKNLPDQAIEEFNRLVEDQPTSAVARESLGRALVAKQRYAEAIESFQKAAQLRPDAARPRYLAGNAAMALQQYADAAAHYRKAVELAPHTVRFQLALASAHELQGDDARATAVYEEVLVANPDEPVLLNNLACLYSKTKQNLPRALTLARRASELLPDNPRILDTLGAAQLDNNQPADALTTLQRAIALAPERGIAHYHLAKAHLAAGRRAEAVASLRTALQRGLPAGEKADAERILAAS